MARRIKIRRGTAAQWTTSNPILSLGEGGLETDTGKIKYGDGVTAWASLAYTLETSAGAQAKADAAVAAAALDATTKANAAQAAAVQRSNHTGTQAHTTITGLGDAATKNVGTTAGTVAAGDDPRFAAPATPNAHAASHATGGSDEITPAAIGAETPAGAQAKADAAEAEAVATIDLDYLTTKFASDPAKALRGIRATGYNNLISPHHKLWRLVRRFNKDNFTAGGYVWPNRVRAVVLGDSVACDPSTSLQAFFGYAGEDMTLQGWVKEAGASPDDNNPINFITWSASGTGVFTYYDEWARTLGGLVVHLDASKAGGTYVEKTNFTAPIHSVFVQYLAGTGYGSFKLQYKQNGTGAWTDCTSATVSASGGSVASGVVNSNNSGAETYSQAVFTLPATDYYHYRIVATSGRAYLCHATGNAGIYSTGAPDGKSAISGGTGLNFSQGGRGIASHFSQWSQSVLTSAFGFIDPHFIVYKSLNEWTLPNYQTHWPALAAKLATAAPNALLVVCGSHPRSSNPINYDDGDIAVDDFLKDWCANNKAVFVDVRQSFPLFVDGYENPTDSGDDLWNDPVHIYPEAGGRANGETWVKTLVFETLRPAFEYALMANEASSLGNVLPITPNEIRLFHRNVNSVSPKSQDQRLSFTTHPRLPSAFVFRSTNNFYNSGTQTYERESGMSFTASYDTISPNSTGILTNGTSAIQCACHPNGPLQGITFGVHMGSNMANLQRALKGFRFLVVDPDYGVADGLIVETKTTHTGAQTRIFGLNINASHSTEGTPLWSWNIGNGSTSPEVIYHGRTDDGNATKYTHDEPAANVTIHTPINSVGGTGAKPRYIGVIPGYANQTAGNAAVEVGEAYYDEAAKKVRVRIS